MRSLWVALTLAAGLLFGPPPTAIASDSELEGEMAEMRALVEQLKEKVDAQSEQLDHQGGELSEARSELSRFQELDRDGASGLPGFLQRLEAEGWVAASYFWNTNNPGNQEMLGGNSGVSGNIYPFHPDHNVFKVNQIWLGVESPVDEDHRAGFRVDVSLGDIGCFLGSGGNNQSECVAGRPTGGVTANEISQIYVNQAYVQYLSSFGTHVKAGKFATIIGAEVAQTTQNYMITRSNLYNLLQPLDHIGILLNQSFGETGFYGLAGVTNSGVSSQDPDVNATKTGLFGVGWEGETFSTQAALLIGNDNSLKSRWDEGLVNLVAYWDPNEKFSSYLDFVWAFKDNNQNGPDSYGWGIAVAGRYAITEKLGTALRVEFAQDIDGFFGFVDVSTVGNPVADTNIFSLAGVVDYELWEGLKLRGEARWDTTSKKNADNDEFFKNTNDFGSHQVVLGGEIYYEF